MSFSLINIDTDTTFNNTYGVGSCGTYFHVARYNSGIAAYSFANETLTYITTQDDGGYYSNICSSGTLLMVSCEGDGIRAYSFDGSTYTLLDTIDDGSVYYQACSSGTFIMSARGSTGFSAYSFNPTDGFTLIDTVDDGNSYTDIKSDGSYIYCACHDGGLRIYTFDGADISLVTSYYDGNNVTWLTVDGNIIHSCGQTGFRAYSFDGSDISGVTSTLTSTWCRAITHDDNFIYVNDGLHIYLYSFDGSDYILEDTYTPSGPQFYSAMSARNNYLIAGSASNGVFAFKVTSTATDSLVPLDSPKFDVGTSVSDQVLFPQTYTRTVTIDHTKVEAELENFPVLISVTEPELKSKSNGGCVTSEYAWDVLFYLNGVKLDHEIDTYTASTGAYVAWVRIPTLSDTEDTVLEMRYGGSAVADPSTTAVWDANYVAVYHMNDVTTSTIKDSTSHSFNGTKASANNPIQVDGKIGKAQDFSDDNISLTGMTSSSYNQTVSVWAYEDTDGVSRYMFDIQTGRLLFALQADVADRIGIYDGVSWKEFNGSPSILNWHYVTFILNSITDKFTLYVDGVLKGETAYIEYQIGGEIKIGSRHLILVTNWYYYDGKVDELKVSDVCRSADWIKTEYANQNSPSTFITLGPHAEIEGMTFLVGKSITDIIHTDPYLRHLTIDHTKVEGVLSDFPVLVSITDPTLKSVSNGGHVWNEAGWDVNFYQDSVKLDHEIDTYDPVAGTYVAWVRIPYLSDTEDTKFQMRYGGYANVNPSTTDVWDANYVAVYHMNDVTTSTIKESTANTFTGNKKGANEPIVSDGKVGKAQDFDGSNDYLSLNNPIAGTHYPENWTMSFWMKNDRDTGFTSYTHLYRPKATTGRLVTINFNNGSVISVYYESGGGAVDSYSYNLPVGQRKEWNLITIKHTYGGASQIFVNGEYKAQDSSTQAIPLGNYGCYLGMQSWAGANNYYYDGKLDEWRFSNIPRNADWIVTEYANQNSPSTFMDIGEEIAKELVTFSIGKVITDLLTPTENSLFDVGSTITDTLIPADGAHLVDIGKYISDLLGLTESNIFAATKIITDTLTPTEGNTFDVSLSPILDESIPSDFVGFGVGSGVTDSLIPVDNTHLMDVGKTIGDSISIGDSVSIFTTAVTITDLLGITDELVLTIKQGFGLISPTYRVTLRYPDWGGVNKNIAKDIQIFDFWNNTFDTVDVGLADKGLELHGIEINITTPADQALALLFAHINSMMNNGEEVEVVGLEDCKESKCYDGIYVIQSFGYNSLRGTANGITYHLSLKYVRNI